MFGQRLILNGAEVEGGAVADLIINIIKTSTTRISLVRSKATLTKAYLVRSTRMLLFTPLSETLTPNLAKLDTAAARTIAFSRMTRL